MTGTDTGRDALRRTTIRLVGLLMLPLLAAACSIRPLPEDVTGYDTVQIVSKIRCEVRDGLRGYVIGALTRPERSLRYPQYLELAAGLDDGSLPWQDFRKHLKTYRVDASTLAVIERYDDAAIAYEFTFDITEQNNHNVGFDLLSPLTRGTVRVGAGGSAGLTRRNERRFRIADTFEKLITRVDDGYCGLGGPPDLRRQNNHIYPISGSLRLDKLVGDFLNLNQSGNLVGPESPPVGDPPLGLPTIIENIEFTTKFVGSVAAPALAATAPVSGFAIARVDYSASHERDDIHRLRIVVKLPRETNKPAAPETIAEQRAFAEAGLRPGPNRADAIKAAAVRDLTVTRERDLIDATIQFRREAATRLMNE